MLSNVRLGIAALVLVACSPTIPPPLSDCEQPFLTEDLSRAQIRALSTTHALVSEHCEGLAKGCSMGLASSEEPFPFSVHVAPVATIDPDSCGYASHPKWTYYFTEHGQLAETRLDLPHPHRNPFHERLGKASSMDPQGTRSDSGEPETEYSYKVILEIRENGELLSAPMLVVRPNVEASVEKDGDTWFFLEFTIYRADSRRIEFDAHYESATSSLAPLMQVDLGRTALMVFDHVEISVTVELTDD